MKVKIYPIQSQLHNQNVLNESTSALIHSLEDENLSIAIETDASKLYEDSDLVLILVQSGGSENLFIKNFAQFKEPYYLLTYGVNNSLAASLEILAFLKNHNLKGEVLHGDTDYIRSRIKALAPIQTTKKGSANLGLIGRSSDWLISSDVDPKNALEKFDVNLVYVPIQELIDEYNKLSSFEIYDSLKDKKFDPKEVSKAERLYNAIKVLVKKYNLSGFTIRCFDLLSTLKTTACLALSHFNDEGIIATCEGDVPSMLGMYVAQKMLNEAAFQCNPSRIDTKNNEILLAHCTIPCNICKSFVLDTHYESGIGVGIHGEVKEGNATIFRLNSALTECFVEEGTIKNNQYENKLCRTQIVCNFPELDKILKTPLGNHELIILGHHKEALVKYFESIGIKLI